MPMKRALLACFSPGIRSKDALDAGSIQRSAVECRTGQHAAPASPNSTDAEASAAAGAACAAVTHLSSARCTSKDTEHLWIGIAARFLGPQSTVVVCDETGDQVLWSSSKPATPRLDGPPPAAGAAPSDQHAPFLPSLLRHSAHSPTDVQSSVEDQGMWHGRVLFSHAQAASQHHYTQPQAPNFTRLPTVTMAMALQAHAALSYAELGLPSPAHLHNHCQAPTDQAMHLTQRRQSYSTAPTIAAPIPVPPKHNSAPPGHSPPSACALGPLRPTASAHPSTRQWEGLRPQQLEGLRRVKEFMAHGHGPYNPHGGSTRSLGSTPGRSTQGSTIRWSLELGRPEAGVHHGMPPHGSSSTILSLSPCLHLPIQPPQQPPLAHQTSKSCEAHVQQGPYLCAEEGTGADTGEAAVASPSCRELGSVSMPHAAASTPCPLSSIQGGGHGSGAMMNKAPAALSPSVYAPGFPILQEGAQLGPHFTCQPASVGVQSLSAVTPLQELRLDGLSSSLIKGGAPTSQPQPQPHAAAAGACPHLTPPHAVGPPSPIQQPVLQPVPPHLPPVLPQALVSLPDGALEVAVHAAEHPKGSGPLMLVVIRHGGVRYTVR